MSGCRANPLKFSFGPSAGVPLARSARSIKSTPSGKRSRLSKPLAAVFSLILILTLISACDMPDSEEKTEPGTASGGTAPQEPYPPSQPGGTSGGGGGQTSGPNYGYANASFRYFYHPRDNKIYYMSENSVYRMDIDGENPEKFKDNPVGDKTAPNYKYQYIYVSDDGTVYYNSRVTNTTYKMGTDGSRHTTAANGKSGPMGVYVTGTGAKLYFANWKRYLKDNTLYYYSGRSLTQLFKRTPPGVGTNVTLTYGQADNFVFAPDGIYFRLRSKGHNAYFGIERVPYNVTHRGSGGGARLNYWDMEQIAAPGTAGINAAAGPKWDFAGSDDRFNTLNVSRDFIAYMRRRHDYWLKDVSEGLNVVIRRGPGASTTPAAIGRELRTRDLAGGISIIGDYIYWMTDNSAAKQYKLYRIKKDGTGYLPVKAMDY